MTAAIPAIGAVLCDTYRIVRPLAEGGCGDVYVATHERLGSEIAVKVLHPGLAGSAQILARLRHEADILSAVRHPHIVQILDFDVTEHGVPFLVMELLDGRPLGEGKASGTPWEPRGAVHVIDQIAQALAAAHAHGIVHLDLKPDNVILISTDGRDDFVKVIDFGISRASWHAGLANQPLVAGTPEYMSPEQAGGLANVIDHRADQFALAAVSYRLLTGHEPFGGVDTNAILQQVMHAAARPPSRHMPWLGGGVDDVIARGLSKRPEARYPGVADFAEALRQAVAAIAIDRRRVSRRQPQQHSDRFAPPATPMRASAPRERPLGLKTLPFIRRTARGVLGRQLLSVCLALTAGALFVRLFPGTWAHTRSAWRQAGATARRVVTTAPARLPSAPEPSNPSAVR